MLDDMNGFIDTNSLETWKALCAGEKTSIRACYVNRNWNKTIPCLILTNSLDLLTRLRTDPMFESQVVCVEITDYMGPLDSRPSFMTNDLQHHLSTDILKKIEFRKEKNDLKSIDSIKEEKKKDIIAKLFSVDKK
jgi:hypothetical protein